MGSLFNSKEVIARSITEYSQSRPSDLVINWHDRNCGLDTVILHPSNNQVKACRYMLGITVLIVFSEFYEYMDIVILSYSGLTLTKTLGLINQRPALLTWFNFNPGMDNSHISLGMDNWFHPILQNGCNYLSILGLNSIHINEKGPKGCTKWLTFCWCCTETHCIAIIVFNSATLNYDPANSIESVILIIFALFKMTISQLSCDKSLPKPITTDCFDIHVYMRHHGILMISEKLANSSLVQTYSSYEESFGTRRQVSLQRKSA